MIALTFGGVVIINTKDRKAYFLIASMVSNEMKESFPEKRNPLWYSQKISELRNHLGLSQAAFAQKLGVSGAAIGQLERGESKSPSADLLAALTSMLAVNLDWLLLGEGEMLKSAEAPKNNSVSTAPKSSHPLTEPKAYAVAEGDNRAALLYNLATAASYLGNGANQERAEPIGIITMPTRLLRSGQHSVFPVIGDSMEPTFFAKDYVLCQFVPQSDWFYLRDDTVAVIVSEDRGLQLKRLRVREAGDEPSYVRCLSDNHTHRPYEIELNDVLEIWRFEWRITSNDLNVHEGLLDRLTRLEDNQEDLRRYVEGLVDSKELKRLESRNNPALNK